LVIEIIFFLLFTESTGPIQITKEELITNSKPELERTIELLENSNPFDSSREELDASNPFSKSPIKRQSSELDQSNPFHTPKSSPNNTQIQDDLSLSKPKSKSKSFRRSMRKTFHRIGSMRKGKQKVNSELTGEEMLPLKPAFEHTNPPPPNNITNDTIDKTYDSITVENTTPYKPPLPPKQKHSTSSPPKTRVITEELAYKMIPLQDSAGQTLEEIFNLGDNGLRVCIQLRLNIRFDVKCSTFELYKSTYEHLYKQRFQELVPTKLPLEGVDCNATVDGEVLLKQITVFSPISPLRVALARYLVLTQAATGQMGTANTIRYKKRVEDSHGNSLPDSPTRSDDSPVYDSKAETVLINPSDLLVQLQRIQEGIKTNLFSVYEMNECLSSSISLCRWLLSHHIERLQTVFPVAGDQVSRKNLGDTLRLMQLMETTAEIRDRFASETQFLKIGGLRDHVHFTVRKYTQLWVAALHKEFIYRRDIAMSQLLEPAETSVETTADITTETEGGDRSFLSPAAIFNDDSTYRLPNFNASDVAEKVPALLSSFVRTVKQFDNNKQIVYLADMVEKKYLGNSYRTQLQTGTLGKTVPMPMLTYQVILLAIQRIKTIQKFRISNSKLVGKQILLFDYVMITSTH